MAVTPEIGNRHAAPVVDLLTKLELDLLQTAALALRGDQSQATWAASAIARIARWRVRADRGAAGSLVGLARAVRTALAGAAADGATTALVDLPSRGDVPPLLGNRGVVLSSRVLTAELATTLQNTPRILEVTLREAVRAGVESIQPGLGTRRNSSQQVLDRLVRNGVTGFRDSSGRNWSLTSYAEMAVRAQVQQQAVEAGTARLRQVGLDLVVVSDSPRECPVCRPFEGKILSLGSETGRVTRTDELTGQPVTVDVYATLDDAKARGFQHPNCTHSFGGYIPGVTRLRKAEANPDGYDARQRQRYLERKIREWKRTEVLALDDAAAARAKGKVSSWQKELRQHVKENDLSRQPGRESITRAV